ncbi:SH3 domain-containing protein, partial [Clostridium sp.]|uniref:SH3 domain-containing protein n=1 Tax=Clostridium sp. TaxID=1506 RepID=UPI0034649362
GAHAQGHNTNTLGICAEGSYNKETMPQAQKQAIIELCKYLKSKYNINSIKGHRELMATNCPGSNYPLEEIINTILNGSNNNVGNTGIVNAKSGLNIRSGAGTNYSILGAIPNGATVNLSSKEGNWWKVSYNDLNGYVSGDYINTSYNHSNNETTEGYVVTGYLGKQLQGYDGAEVAGAIRHYFKDIDRVYVRSNSIGMWLETQILPIDKCNELKERLGSFFDSIR